jgi:hypothetical protein
VIVQRPANQEFDMARGTEEVFADAPELAAEWRAEIARRAAEIDAGEVELIPGDVVFREAFERLQGVREWRS